MRSLQKPLAPRHCLQHHAREPPHPQLPRKPELAVCSSDSFGAGKCLFRLSRLDAGGHTNITIKGGFLGVFTLDIELTLNG